MNTVYDSLTIAQQTFVDQLLVNVSRTFENTGESIQANPVRVDVIRESLAVALNQPSNRITSTTLAARPFCVVCSFFPNHVSRFETRSEAVEFIFNQASLELTRRIAEDGDVVDIKHHVDDDGTDVTRIINEDADGWYVQWKLSHQPMLTFIDDGV